MKILLLIVSTLFTTTTFAGSFDHLTSVKPIDASPVLEIKYNPKNSKVIKKPATDPMLEEGSILVLETKISSGGSKTHQIYYNPGPSEDPTYEIFEKSGSTNQHLGSISGWKLVIPGNGNLYVSGHTNNLFDQKKKFTLSEGKITEIKQPYYYVGITSKTLKPITLYADKELTKKLAFLPAGYQCEILINEKETFLIRTPFGLTGWAKINTQVAEPRIFKEIYYAGD